MNRMALEEKVPCAHDADTVDVRVVGTLPHDHDLLVVVSCRLQRGDLSLPGLACEHLVSRLHVEQLEIRGVLEQAASIDVPLPLVRWQQARTERRARLRNPRQPW